MLITLLSSMDVLITSYYQTIRISWVDSALETMKGSLWPDIDLEMWLPGPTLKKEGPTLNITHYSCLHLQKGVSMKSFFKKNLSSTASFLPDGAWSQACKRPLVSCCLLMLVLEC